MSTPGRQQKQSRTSRPLSYRAMGDQPAHRPPPPPPPPRRLPKNPFEQEDVAHPPPPSRPKKGQKSPSSPSLIDIYGSGRIDNDDETLESKITCIPTNPFDSRPNSTNTKKVSKMDNSNPWEEEGEESDTFIKSQTNSPLKYPPLSYPTSEGSSKQRGNNESQNNIYAANEVDESSSEVSVVSNRPPSLRKYQENFDIKQPPSRIYDKKRFSSAWAISTIIIHTIQTSLLISAAKPLMSSIVYIILVFSSFLVPLLIVLSRFYVKKANINFCSYEKMTPDKETDVIPDRCLYILSAAVLLEGGMFALFSGAVAGQAYNFNKGFYSQQTILQTLGFASVTMLSFHQIIRPANRVDPLRTMLELEVVAVCWDALDGSTIFELLDSPGLSYNIIVSLRCLMAFWYLSVGFRISIMYLVHLSPSAWIHKYILAPPLSLSPQPTVDRTLQALKLRSMVVLSMACAEIFAATIRIILWTAGNISALQQEMTVKNCVFLINVSGAYSMWKSTKTRDWNKRTILFNIKYPSRNTQLALLRIWFCVTYLLIGALLSSLLIEVSEVNDKFWTLNVITDFILSLFFFFYCKNCHRQSSNYQRVWFLPQESFVLFPARFGFVLSLFMVINLYVARIPSIYRNHNNFSEDGLYTYGNALLIITFSIIPLALCALYWSIAYMLFRKEFTASPGNYNAIHDPTISMVAMSSMIEGAMDIISCAQLMELATYDLDFNINSVIILFCLLEMLNASLSLGFQALLSGGHDDTPLDLVRWKSLIRVVRGFVDLGCLFLRLTLWVKYQAVSSVFLVKNLFNLFHTFNQAERYYGAKEYSEAHVLFTEYVPPQEWYGLTKEEWRKATSETILMQAKSGRAV